MVLEGVVGPDGEGQVCPLREAYEVRDGLAWEGYASQTELQGSVG